MRKWIIVACLLIMPVLAYSGSNVTNVITAVTADTTAADTSNCINLYKPYRIVIPPGTDSLVGRVMLQEFADFLDLQVDEVYARVRDAVCRKLAQDLELPCKINADTLWPCARDTLTLIYKGVAIKDTASGRDKGSAILIYEGLGDSSTSDGVAGPEYVGFMVNRDSTAGDTNQVTASYVMVLPPHAPSFSDDRIPGTAGYSAGTAKGNSELLCDSTGNLYWIDRDWFERAMVDTIIADTMTSGGDMMILAQVVELKAHNETRSQVGAWVGSGLNVTALDWFEAMDNGNNYIEIRPQANLVGTWTLVLPDSGNEFEGGYLRFVDGATLSPKWAPQDDQYIIWGMDTCSCNTTTKTVTISKGYYPTGRTPDPGQAMPMFDNRSFYPEVEWILPHPDSNDVAPYFAWRNGDKPVGMPAPTDARYLDLYVISTFDEDQLNPGQESSAMTLATDSTFVVHFPSLGCDSVWSFRWKVTGHLKKYQGEG